MQAKTEEQECNLMSVCIKAVDFWRKMIMQTLYMEDYVFFVRVIDEFKGFEPHIV